MYPSKVMSCAILSAQPFELLRVKIELTSKTLLDRVTPNTGL